MGCSDFLTSLISEPMYSDVRGVCSAGLITRVFPQHSAGAIFQTSISNGKFHCKNTRLVRSTHQSPTHFHAAFSPPSHSSGRKMQLGEQPQKEAAGYNTAFAWTTEYNFLDFPLRSQILLAVLKLIL